MKASVTVRPASPGCSQTAGLRLILCLYLTEHPVSCSSMCVSFPLFVCLFYRFEKLAQGCKKDMDILQLARAQGMDPPSHHFEERTFKMIRCGKTKEFLRLAGMGFLVSSSCLGNCGLQQTQVAPRVRLSISQKTLSTT